MKPKKKICSGCNQERYIWKNDKGNRYCKYCWSSHCVTDKQIKPTKPSKPIAHRSTKRAKQEREYLKIRRSLLLSSPTCQAHLPNICTGHATEIHHMKGRIGSLLTDTDHFLLVCRSCHQWIELNPAEAKELGFSKTRI